VTIVNAAPARYKNNPQQQRTRLRRLPLACAATALLFGTPATALQFQLGEAEVRLDNLLTIGALMRMQERDSSLIGKSNLTPGLCVRRTSPDGDPNRTYEGDACGNSGDGAGNRRALEAPGALSVNGDNGNLNFDQHELVHAAAKLTSDLSVNIYDFNVFVRGLYFFDQRYENLQESHPDTTLQAARSEFPRAGREVIGSDLRLLDYFVSRNFEWGEHPLSLKIGNQVLNWGESAFLALNSLNTINPPNSALLRLPGFDVKELFQPVGMALLNAELREGINLEGFYQYDWEPVVIDPVGSFFSSSDTFGAGGRYAMLSFGKAPEDPERLYRPVDNPDDAAAALGSTASRTLLRDYDEERRRRPREGGQYGFALKLFLDQLNNGTELAFYQANYHARVPSISALAAQDTCLPPSSGNAATNFAALVVSCGVPPTNLAATQTGGPFLPALREPLPIDTPRVFLEYPEDIHLYGVSFNTTIGDYALSGEYAFRDNLPIQVHATDVLFAALQPAFPEGDYDLAVATLPGRRTAVPDFVATNYRGEPVTAGSYVRGYERMKVGQLGLTLLRTVGGDNWLRASQMTLLLETGLTHVLDFPELSELQFQGAAVDTHITNGADGSVGLNPADVRSDPNDPRSSRNDPALLQNPTAQDRSGYGTQYSWGYRALALTRYDSAIAGINLELLTALFHDVQGVAPGLGQNFVEGRKQILLGLRGDFLSRYTGELRYTWYTGGGLRDALRDRDNLLLFLGYQF